MEGDAVKITKRHLPHWTKDGASYFITFRTKSDKLSYDDQICVLHHIKNGDGKFYNLSGVIVMIDHVHMIISPIAGFELSRIMKGIKGVSARKMNLLRNGRGSIWQNESYDRIIRDEREFNIKMRYMLNNPVKKGLTDDPSKYHGWYCKDA